MTDLVTLQEYKEYKGQKNPEDDSKRLTIISAVSALVETYCDRKFKSYYTYPAVEYYSALNTELYLRNFPVVEVVSVELSINGGVSYDPLIEADPEGLGYLVNLEEGILYTQNPRRPFAYIVQRAFNSLKVTYRAGYETLPLDLKLAVMDLVHYYEKEQQVPSKSLMSANVENAIPYDSIQFPAHIARILNMYRAPVLGV